MLGRVEHWRRGGLGLVSRVVAVLMAGTLGVVSVGAVPGGMGGGVAFAQGVVPPPPDGDQLGAVPRGIVAVGTAEVRTAPDVAFVNLGVEAQAPTARAAINQVSTAANDIISALLALGIPEQNIQTAEISLFPIREQPQPPRPAVEEPAGPPPILGFRAVNRLRVTVTNLNQLGQVLDQALSAGANVVGGVEFGLRNETQVRQQALQQAVMEARRNAETIANTLGLGISGVQSVIEEGPGGPITPFGRGGIAVAEAGIAPPVQPGELTVRSQVRAIFNLQ